MPKHETALAETLHALRTAVAATLNVARTSSETARQAATEVADDRLADARRRIDELAQAAADEPTLFGQKVGDGLDVERAQARLAVGLLRRILTDHVILDGAYLTLTGAVRVTPEDLVMIDALTSKE